MGTLFDKFYDSLGHEMQIGMTVMACTMGGHIYGHIVDLTKDKNENDKFVIVPDIGCTNNLVGKLKKRYKINWRNVYLIKVTKK